MARSATLRLFRTTGFKLTAIFLVVFAVFAAFLIGYIARNTTGILQAEMRDAVDAELGLMSLQYQRGGIPHLARVVERRSHQPGASLYLITDADGRKIAGNVEIVPDAVMERAGPDAQVVPYVWRDEAGSPQRYSALVRVIALPDGGHILVGRDVSESEQLVGVVRRALVLTAVLTVALGLIAWIFVSRRVLKRIDAIADTSRRFAAGDLAGRLQVTGTGDEFDRLAESLNTMLTRIERLMLGLKQVSDNIAHDLKTPLTRMRSRVERVLARGGTEPEYREALQATIEEADQLIQTFNALLMIARMEAGSSDAEFSLFDASAVARDVYELYEPLAEEAGVALRLKSDGPVMVRANRELISQALANLVDNAVKYSEEGSEQQSEVVISVSQDAGLVTLGVSDNGAGIAECDRARAMERFVRLEESRSKPGAGLGLSLVSAVAQLHGGDLVLSDNAPGLAAILHVPGAAAGRAA
jgi:signal transduction histidine kinase